MGPAGRVGKVGGEAKGREPLGFTGRGFMATQYFLEIWSYAYVLVEHRNIYANCTQTNFESLHLVFKFQRRYAMHTGSKRGKRNITNSACNAQSYR